MNIRITLFITLSITLIISDIAKIMKKLSLAYVCFEIAPAPGFGNTLKNATALVDLKYNHHSGKYTKVC